jgi:hypothetical protein
MKTVLYACTNLDYDQIFSPVAPTPGVDFVLFADRRPWLVRGWQWRPLPPATRGLSPTLVNRYAKFFPQELFPGTDVSIYVDANTLILSDLTPLIDEFAASGADIGLFPHKERTNIAEELAFARAVGRVPPEDAARGEAQLAFYAAEGLPENHPFTENAIIFRRHASPALAPAMRLWWEQLGRFTRRDQLSLPYVLWKTGLRTKIWDWNYKHDNPYFKRYLHRKDSALKNMYVYTKNRRYYSRFSYYFYGAILSIYQGVFKGARVGQED